MPKRKRPKRPKVPKRYEVPGTKVLVIVEDNSYEEQTGWLEAWCLERFKNQWRIRARSERIPIPFSIYEKPPKERTPQALAQKYETFSPDIILFYPRRFYTKEGRALWRGLYMHEIEEIADRTPGPVLVEGWDEDGWPIGHRIPLE